MKQPTFGGLQLWTDHAFRDGFCVQQHAITKKWRLLDAKNYLIFCGKREACDAKLDALCSKSRWDLVATPIVVLLHGLMRTSHCMKPLHRRLETSDLGRILRYRYASSRASIRQHAAALAEYIESLPPKSPLSFVGHSMGNIVLRSAIGTWSKHGDPLSVIPRLHRIVMLGPPNQGANIARRLSWTGVFGLINGPGGEELGERWKEIEADLAIPPCPFAIVAGDRSGSWLQNPLLSGPNDWLVAVDEARLPGVTEFITMPVLHTTLMSSPKAIDFVVNFLQKSIDKPLPKTQ